MLYLCCSADPLPQCRTCSQSSSGASLEGCSCPVLPLVCTVLGFCGSARILFYFCFDFALLQFCFNSAHAVHLPCRRSNPCRPRSGSRPARRAAGSVAWVPACSLPAALVVPSEAWTWGDISMYLDDFKSVLTRPSEPATSCLVEASMRQEHLLMQLELEPPWYLRCFASTSVTITGHLEKPSEARNNPQQPSLRGFALWRRWTSSSLNLAWPLRLAELCQELKKSQEVFRSFDS